MKFFVVASVTMLFVGFLALAVILEFVFLKLHAQQDKIEVASYVCYYGDWTVLHVNDENRQTQFYLAYHRTTRETVICDSYNRLLELLS